MNGRRISNLFIIMLLTGTLWLENGFAAEAWQSDSGQQTVDTEIAAVPGSYVFWADTYEEAQAIAGSYGAVLCSYENGIGTLQFLEETVTLLVSENRLTSAALSGTVELYPNYLYTVETAAAGNGALVQWHAEYLELPSVWEMATGKNVRVAIVDSGIDTDHPALNRKRQ